MNSNPKSKHNKLFVLYELIPNISSKHSINSWKIINSLVNEIKNSNNLTKIKN